MILHHDQKDVVESWHYRRGGRSGWLAGDTASRHKDHSETCERGPQPSSALFRAWEQEILNDAQDPIGHLAGKTHLHRASVDNRSRTNRVSRRSPHRPSDQLDRMYAPVAESMMAALAEFGHE